MKIMLNLNLKLKKKSVCEYGGVKFFKVLKLKCIFMEILRTVKLPHPPLAMRLSAAVLCQEILDL